MEIRLRVSVKGIDSVATTDDLASYALDALMSLGSFTAEEGVLALQDKLELTQKTAMKVLGSLYNRGYLEADLVENESDGNGHGHNMPDDEYRMW